MSTSAVERHMAGLSPEDQQTLRLIASLGQEHLVDHWPSPGQDMEKKRRLLAQVRGLDARYQGGLQQYLANAAQLLGQSMRAENPYAGFVPQVPQGYKLEFGGPDFRAAATVGTTQGNRCGFVLVAGGLGERLGFAGIKIALPAETATERTFLQLYIEHILALQRRANRSLSESRCVPLAIMTSDDTHAATQRLLDENDNFGLASHQVTLLKQEKVASVVNNPPALAARSDDPYELATKPHGHGDVHALLHQTGLAERWLSDGVRWVVFFQDTNALAMNSIAPGLGVSSREALEVNSIVVPRRAGEAVGGLVRLEAPGKGMTVNVEYNQLDPLLRATVSESGDVPDRTGYSPYPGNTNILILSLAEYARTLERTGGAVPEFINPKYSDAERRQFAPTRLECMMQDYPRLLPGDAKIAFTQLERTVCFSPVKNSLETAAMRQERGLPAEAPATGEADVYGFHRMLLRRAGADVPDGLARSYRGVSAALFPIVVLSPELTTSGDLEALSVSGVRITSRSALIIDAANVVIEDLELDGALVIRGCPGARIIVRGVVVRNRGWRSLELDQSVSPELAIRGFQLDRQETRVIEALVPGDHLVEI